MEFKSKMKISLKTKKLIVKAVGFNEAMKLIMEIDKKNYENS